MAEKPQAGRLREYHVMLKRTEGIVLRTIPYGEADLIVTCLTLDFGLMKLFAKSPRKFKSRFGSSLEPLTHAKIAFWGKEDASLPKLTQSDIIHPFQSIREKLNIFLQISEIIELTISFVPERDLNRKVYLLFLNTLKEIEQGGNEDLLIHNYKIKFLQFSGFAPRLDSCGRCGEKGFRFYLSQGSILCSSCFRAMSSSRTERDAPIRISPAVAQFYNDLLTWETEKIRRIKPSAALLSDLSHILNMHIRYILAKTLKSESFIRALSQKVR